MNTSTEHIVQCNQSEPLADASGRVVDLMNENGSTMQYSGGYSEGPANTRHRPDVGPMLDQRRRRWANNGPTLVRCLVFVKGALYM